MSLSLGEVEREVANYYVALEENGCQQTTVLCRFAGDDLSPEERAAFSAHLETCPECRDELKWLGEMETTWRDGLAHPARPVAARRWLRPAGLVTGLSAMAAALLWMVLPSQGVDNELTHLRTKGGWELHVAAHSQDRTYRVPNGSTLQTGDRLGFFYSADEPGFLMILYADQAGKLVHLFPAGSELAALTEPGRKVRIPDGARLSPGVGCEWVVALRAPESFSVQTAQAMVRRMVDSRQLCELATVPEAGIQVRVHMVQR